MEHFTESETRELTDMLYREAIDRSLGQREIVTEPPETIWIDHCDSDIFWPRPVESP